VIVPTPTLNAHVATKQYVDESVVAGATGFIDPPPAYSDLSCTHGQWSFDSSYYYLCLSSGTWDRHAITLTGWNSPAPVPVVANNGSDTIHNGTDAFVLVTTVDAYDSVGWNCTSVPCSYDNSGAMSCTGTDCTASVSPNSCVGDITCVVTATLGEKTGSSGNIVVAYTPPGGTEWLETFNVNPGSDKTWLTMTADPDHTTGCLSGQCLAAEQGEAALTGDFNATNNLWITIPFKTTGTGPGVNSNSLIQLLDSSDAPLVSLQYRTSNILRVYTGASVTGTVLTDIRPDPVSYIVPDQQYYIKMNLIQSAVGDDDTFNAWMSTDGSTWIQMTAPAAFNWPNNNMFAKLSLLNETSFVVISDEIKITTDGVEVSNY